MSASTGEIVVEVSRSAFLRNLRRLKLDGPLAAGDEFEVKVSAKLLDGTPVSASFKALIVGDREDKAEQKDDKKAGDAIQREVEQGPDRD